MRLKNILALDREISSGFDYKEKTLPVIVINVRGLGNDQRRLRTAAPPRVGEDLVGLDGDVVSLVHPDPTVGTVVHLVVVNPDVVPGPGHDAPPNELVGLDQSVLHGLAVSDVVIGSDNLQAGDLYPGHVGHHDPARPVELQHGGVVGQVGDWAGWNGCRAGAAGAWRDARKAKF